jgi:DNA-binding beta-propeller fold protein YncE
VHGRAAAPAHDAGVTTAERPPIDEIDRPSVRVPAVAGACAQAEQAGDHAAIEQIDLERGAVAANGEPERRAIGPARDADAAAEPVGVAATAGGVFVADQESNTVYALRAGAVTPFATGLESADLLTVLPDGSLVTGGKAGVVSKIGIDGRVTIVAQGFDQVRGIAYDPDGKRLFVVDHSKATPHRLHIVALP